MIEPERLWAAVIAHLGIVPTHSHDDPDRTCGELILAAADPDLPKGVICGGGHGPLHDEWHRQHPKASCRNEPAQ